LGLRWETARSLIDWVVSVIADFNNQLRSSPSLRCYSAGMNPHESAFAESFIAKARRERALELLASSKNRHKFTSKFDHHGRDYFKPECIRSIEPRHQHPPNIADMLRAMGAPETCHVIGGEHDGNDMELLTALKQIVGYGTGTVLSCIPGKLAYFEGEIRERFLLVRT
jgi:hypothetical protein